MINRRQLLSSLLGGSAVAVLAGCGGTTSAATIAAQAVSDIGLIASGLAGAGIGVPANVSSLISQIGQIASTVSAATTVTAGQSAVSQIVPIFNNLVSVAAALPLPPQFSVALQAAAVLVPVIESAIGFVASAPSTAATVPIMTPTQARAILATTTRH